MVLLLKVSCILRYIPFTSSFDLIEISAHWTYFIKLFQYTCRQDFKLDIQKPSLLIKSHLHWIRFAEKKLLGLLLIKL